MAKMRPEEELIRQDKAFRNPAAAPVADPRTVAAPAAASAASPVTEESALQAAQADKDTALSRLWPGPVDEPKKFPEASGTGFYTSEGLPIESSYGLASDFWSQIGINNILDQTPSGAMSYQGYLAYNGITDPRMTYRRNLDAAQEMYARAIGTYGASGEGLAQGNLANAGYSEYLTGLAYQQKVANTMQAQSQLRQDLAQTAMQYQQYVANYDAQKQAEEATAAAAEQAEAEELSADYLTAYDYFKNNQITNESDYETAVVALRNQGLSDVEIKRALDAWISELATGVNSEIAKNDALAIGNAEALRNAYGANSELYGQTLESLQKKNEEMVDEVLTAITTGKDDRNLQRIIENVGVQYEWHDRGGLLDALANYMKDMVYSGDLSEEAYKKAIYKITEYGISEQSDNGRSGQDRLRNMAQELSVILSDPSQLDDGDYEKLVESAAKAVDTKDIYKDGKELRVKFDVKGKSVLARFYVKQVLKGSGREKGLYEKDGKLYYSTGTVDLELDDNRIVRNDASIPHGSPIEQAYNDLLVAALKKNLSADKE